MALKRIYESEEEIPEELRALYIEQDGQFVLDAEPGESDQSAEDVRKALRARDNEKAERERALKELEELKARYKDVDPNMVDELKKMEKEKEDMEHERLIAEKKFEEAAEKKFERRIAEMQHALDSANKQIEEQTARHQTLREKYSKSRITDALSNEFLAQDTDPKKLSFLIATAKQQWELDQDDEPAPIDWVDGGKTKITAVGADGGTLSMKEHIKSILAENPWAVLESKGSHSQHQLNGVNQNGVYVIPASEAGNIRQYEAHKANAEKQGLDWVIADA